MTLVALEKVASGGRHSPWTEAELVGTLTCLLRARWPVRAIGIEIRSHGRCRTDICVRLRDMHGDRGTDVVVGIEAKLSNWSRALRQAVLNRYAVDASMIAMPTARLAERVIDAASTLGVGVLAVGERSLAVIVPARLGTPDPVLAARVRAQLTSVRLRGGVEVREVVMEGER